MEFILTESQLLRCIKENKEFDILPQSLKRMNSFVKNMVSRVQKTYGLNLRMLLTWGTSIGGLVMPLDEFLKSGNFELSQDQRYLILTGLVFTIFFEGKRGVGKVLTKIKEEGLSEIFDVSFAKGKELKESFSKFLSSSKIIISQLVEVVSYAFLIPIIVDIQNAVTGTKNIAESAALITERLLSSGAILISREILFDLIKKLVRKLK